VKLFCRPYKPILHPDRKSQRAKVRENLRLGIPQTKVRVSLAAVAPYQHANIGNGKTIMKHGKRFTVIIERDEAGYYVASVPALRGCHTQARTLDTLMKRVREAIEVCLRINGDRGESLELVGIQQISV
jgi:predicted RNase H-like HicB family nuclease